MSPWAKEALASGEITQEQALKAAENAAKIMAAKWRPAPGEEPPDKREHADDPYVEMRRWCKENPGLWAVIEGGAALVAQRHARYGFETKVRNSVRDDQGKLTGDVWVRWPAPEAPE